MKDSDIVELYLSRDERAIAEASDKYGRYCFSISYGILNSREDAEECVNDAYLSAWSSIPPHRPENLSVYLGKLTRNHSINKLKKYGAEKRGSGQVDLALSELEECISGESTVDDALEEKTLAEAISGFLHSLSELKRCVFVRRYWHLQSVKDIAEYYGISESKTASMLFRLRRELKKHLTKEGIDV